MTSGKRHFIFISTAALVLALIALLFVFAPSALAQEARFTGEPLPATRAAGDSTFHREFSVASHIFLINGYMKITYNKGLSSERELIIYESVSLKTAESCIIMGDAPVYNAKGVNIS